MSMSIDAVEDGLREFFRVSLSRVRIVVCIEQQEQVSLVILDDFLEERFD